MVTFPSSPTLSYPKAQGGFPAAGSLPSSLPHTEFPNLLPQAVLSHLTKAKYPVPIFFGKQIIVVTICSGDKYLLEWMRQSLKDQVSNLK